MTSTGLPARPPQAGDDITINGTVWRVEHVDQRAAAYGLVVRWVGGHRPAEGGNADLYALITVTCKAPAAAA